MVGAAGEALAVGFVPVARWYYGRQRGFETAAFFLAGDREGVRTSLKMVGCGLTGARRSWVGVPRKDCRRLLHRGMGMCYLRR